MKRAPPANPTNGSPPRLAPSAENAALALREAATLMAPVALWLLRHGASYPAFADMLKGVFLDAARKELDHGAGEPTQSALSTLSGVHRKDVRAFAEKANTALGHARVPLSSEVVMRWLTHARYRGANGQPRSLPRTGATRSFEALCRELSSDVHPRTVLDELLRLGQVALDGERVAIVSNVPVAQLDKMNAQLSSSAADHIAAAVSNVTTNSPKFLEQSVFADGLTQDSIELLHTCARQLWSGALDQIVPQTRECVDADAHVDGDRRVRIGMYFFSEPTSAPTPPSKTSQAKTSARQRPARAGSKP
jgi:hypothetical protein